MTAEEVKKTLAAYAHLAWSGWMNYLFSKCERAGMDDLMVIPDWAVDRWKRQAATPYSAMPENEKESDREEADTMLAIIQPLITTAISDAEAVAHATGRLNMALAVETEKERCAEEAKTYPYGDRKTCDGIAAAIRKGVK